MTYSIYHFFKNLIDNRQSFWELNKLEDFPIKTDMIAYQGGSAFPDMALKVNVGNTSLPGGELIEFKNARSYTVASFNSQIPQQTKALDKLAENVLSEMRDNDPATESLPIREVYYLVRGRIVSNSEIIENKICLLSGKFFETVSVSNLIQNAFEQVIDERRDIADAEITEDFKRTLADLFSEQESFSKTRQVDNASVSIRFRIMTQAVGPGNILSHNQYPEIETNTLNLVLPFHSMEEKDKAQHHMRDVMGNRFEELEQFVLKHPYNGSFWVFQIAI